MGDRNTYSESISKWYDRIMAAGYYNHKAVAEAVKAALGPHRGRVLELGVGTGLLAEALVVAGYSVTGIDFSRDMLEIARKRLGASADLHCQNILSLSLSHLYDAAISQGGVWYMACSQAGGQFLESHLVEEGENADALAKVARALVPRGLFIVGVQDEHRDFAGLNLDGGAEYSQSVSYRGPLIEKDYHVKKGDEILACQHCTFRRFSSAESELLLTKAGFADLGSDASGLFRVFERRP